MKKLIYILFTLLFIISCSSLKKTNQTSLKTSVDSKASLSKDIKQSTDSSLTDKSKTNKEKEIVKTFDQVSSQSGNITGTLKTYDPTLPIDPSTGKHPLVSELDFTNKTVSDNKVNNTEKINVNSGIVNDIKVAVKKGLDVKVDSSAEVKAIVDQKVLTTKSRTSSWWWIAIIVAGGVGAGTFLLKKFPLVVIWDKIKGLFKK